MSEIDKRVNGLIEQLVPRRRPPLLYHYTSGAGLIGILKAGGIWATGIRFLNDAQEFSLAIELAKSIASHRLDTASSYLNKGLYRVIAESIDRATGFGVSSVRHISWSRATMPMLTGVSDESWVSTI